MLIVYNMYVAYFSADLRSWPRQAVTAWRGETHQFPLNSTFVAYTEEIVDEFSHNANKELI